jgi:hypothetical protein
MEYIFVIILTPIVIVVCSYIGAIIGCALYDITYGNTEEE